MQHCIVVQEKSIDDKEPAYYVTIIGVFYKDENIVTAMNICFKMFQVFNLEYPVEAYNTWLFL